MKKLLGFIVFVALVLTAGPTFAGGFIAAAGEDPFGDVWQYVIPKTPIVRKQDALAPVTTDRMESAVLSSLRRIIGGFAYRRWSPTEHRS